MTAADNPISFNTDQDAEKNQPLPPRKPPVLPVQHSSNIWLISFTDIIALMLTFFVMIFAMSNPKTEAWSHLVTSLGSEFRKAQGGPAGSGAHSHAEISGKAIEKGVDTSYLGAVLYNMLEKHSELSQIRLTTTKDKLILSLPHDLIFETGSAKLSPAGRQALTTLAGTLKHLRNKIEIYGHSDPAPISKNSRWNSNWSLSLARALSVAGTLTDAGFRRDLSVLGLADTEYDKIPATLSQEERYARSRRVDIVIHEERATGGFWDF